MSLKTTAVNHCLVAAAATKAMPDLSVSMNWVEALTPSDLSNCPAGSKPIRRDKHLVEKKIVMDFIWS